MTTYKIPAPTGAHESKQEPELLPPGEYDLEIIFATDKDGEGVPLTTRAGDPRIKLKVMDEDERSFYHFLIRTIIFRAGNGELKWDPHSQG